MDAPVSYALGKLAWIPRQRLLHGSLEGQPGRGRSGAHACRMSRRPPLLHAGAMAIVLALGAPAAAGPTGSVTGTVTLAGAPPVRPQLPVQKDREVCGEMVPDDRLVIGPRGAVRYAVVTVDGVQGGRKPQRDATLVLDNRACHFVPHVQTAEVGQWLELHNGDPVLHNADARIGPETIFNVALPHDHRTRRPLARPGLVVITCDVHRWMNAFVAVTDHPYHVVTDASGTYEIRDLPAGTYRIRIWHEELGTQEQPLTIEAGKPAEVNFTYSGTGNAGQEPR
jgi:plastocyanin